MARRLKSPRGGQAGCVIFITASARFFYQRFFVFRLFSVDFPVMQVRKSLGHPREPCAESNSTNKAMPRAL
jgi:hypothetical protein